jgi:hypothetical protein
MGGGMKRRSIYLFRIRIHWALLFLAGAAIGSGAQEREVIQAQAFGTQLAAGRTFGITIHIESYSTPEDQKELIDAFQKGGNDALVDKVSKMKARGRVAIAGQVGYQIAYIRNIPGKDGRTIRLMTDRPINIGETFSYQRSREYNLTLLEIHIKEDPKKSKGTLVIGGKFMVDKKTNQIIFETYRNTPWRLENIMERE